MSAVLRSRAGHPPSASSASASSASASTPSSARSAPPGFAWRYSGDGGTESPMTALTTPATSRESGDEQQLLQRKWIAAGSASGGSPLAQQQQYDQQLLQSPSSLSVRSPSSPQNKRERRKLVLHSPVGVEFGGDVDRERPLPEPPLTPPVHSHPLEDEGDGSNGPDSALDPPEDYGRGWLAALEGEVGEQEMDGVALSPPTFATADPEDFDPDDDMLDLDGGFLDDPNKTDTRVRAREERSPSPIRYARRSSVDVDMILSDSSDEEDEMSDLDRAPSRAADATSYDSPAPSIFNDARSTFSRARSTRSRRKRRNTRAAPPPVPLGSAAGMHRRARAHSADSSIIGLGDTGMAPSEMWRMEQAARAARVATPNMQPVPEMRYMYQAAAARLPASVPPPPALLLGRGSDGSSQYDSTSASISGHGHGSSDSGLQYAAGGYYGTPSTSKSSLPALPEPPARRETVKLTKKERKERERVDKEREKALRKSAVPVPHRTSFSLLRGGGGTANSSAEGLMMRGSTERVSSSSNGSDEAIRTTRATKPALFRSLYGDPVRGR
ncbi:hypothetical protein R3P38DRAFT_2874630 [Favolaschia claudopus]|uniref:Uncharacterized protein n=1 Tax=Favolaschia claudopus TaxID=2862362 RepID=A0AAW0D6F7_9AGAR